MSSDDVDPPPVDPYAPPADVVTASAGSSWTALITNGRLHPLSPMFGLARFVRRNIVAVVIGVVFASMDSTLTYLIATGFVLTVVRELANYLTLRYRIDAGQLIVDHGWVFRTHRTVPINRIQNIDSMQTVLHRWFGVAEVRVETASGKEPEAVLRVLSLADLERLRAAATLTVASTDASPPVTDEISEQDIALETNPAAAESIVTIPPTQLLIHGALGLRGLVFIPVVFGLLADTADGNSRIGFVRDAIRWVGTMTPTGPIALGLIGVGLILIGMAGSALVFAARFYDYRLQPDGEDLRVSFGLFTRQSATIIRRKVQFVSVHTTPWSRLLGLATIRIETAGGSTGGGSMGGGGGDNNTAVAARRWFVPSIHIDRVDGIVRRLRDTTDPSLADSSNADLLSADSSNADAARLDVDTWRSVSGRAAWRITRVTIIAVVGVWLVAAVVHLWGGPFGSVVHPRWGLRHWSTAAVATAVMALGWVVGRKRLAATRYRMTPRWIEYRSGLWVKKRSLCFFDRVQTARITRTPLDRRWSMAKVDLDTAAAGPAGHRMIIPRLDDIDAAEIMQRAWSGGGREAPDADRPNGG